MQNLDQRFADTMGQLLGPDFPSDIALAVSGGGDSMAMLTLAHNWTRVWGIRLWVVTVDHGLRPESAAEAQMVAKECAALGHPHATLRWHWDGTGNKMDAARRARLDLIARWRGDIQHVLMAHTQDDLAETFLMRLKRGSGLDGLAAMEPKRQLLRENILPIQEADCDGDRPSLTGQNTNALTVLRPCLDMSRAELRHYLKVLKGRWVEDPSNDDPSYDRARIRKALALLAEEGIETARLAETAERLREEKTSARTFAALKWQDEGRLLQTGAGQDTGILVLNPDWHLTCPIAVQRRLLAAMLRFVACADYAPRAEALEDLRERLVSGGTGTLHGCDVMYRKGALLLFREYNSVSAQQEIITETTLWDGRWRVTDKGQNGRTLRALGQDGWEQAKGDQPVAVPHRAALSLPSIWQENRLIACDGLDFGPGGTVSLAPQGAESPDFSRFLLSH